jgi:asparagine synthase (glutamine-hydrolysing)
MCGIAGVVRSRPQTQVDRTTLLRMAAAIRHRGPDGFGLATAPGAGLVSTRLAIFDIPGGWQPLESPDARATLVYNGEVYNHPELRAELEADGERFATTCDTEVVLRLLVREGPAALDRLNGQWAMALWEPAPRRLTMIRDRFGVRPLYFSLPPDGSLVFASEVKALFASGLVDPAPDPAGFDQVFTLWGARPPRTPFRGVRQLPPGALAVWEDGRIVAERRWWAPDAAPRSSPASPRDTEAAVAELELLMRDSVRLRLRADVPVGTYLSGGLDSSLISAIAQAETDHQLRTFSIAFSDSLYDERAHQQEVARAIGTEHHVVDIDSGDIAAALPDVIAHTETPLVRTAPVPMYLLARAVRAAGITVIATGEGADELFWGYDLFKEVVLREIAVGEPERAEELLDGLYRYLGPSSARRGPAWRRFILDAGDLGDPIASHLTRATSTAALKAFYAPALAADVQAAEADGLDALRAAVPERVAQRGPLERAEWLELTTLLEPYLLSTQGDRVAMAHAVEGRYPFLDHRVFGYAAGLPAEMKLDQLADKVVLRDLATRVLPQGIAERPKQPYRAPGVSPFFSDRAPAWVDEVLSQDALTDAGLWEPSRVAGLLRRCRAGKVTSPREEMALVGVLSAQLWYREFIAEGRSWPEETATPRVLLEREGELAGKVPAR